MAFVEPSILSFDPFKEVNNYQDELLELNDFRRFAENLDDVLNTLKEKKYKIFVSREYWEEIQKKIPVSLYEDNSRYSIARELLMIKLPGFIRGIHNFGDAGVVGTLNENLIINPHLLNSELYFLWVDLLLSNENYPRSLLKSRLLTICRSDKIIVSSDEGSVEYFAYDRVPDLASCPDIIKYELRDLIRDQSLPSEIPCHGTGTHDSMWGIKIQELADIPKPERELFTRLLDTRLIKRITLLSFEKKTDVAPTPFIKIINVEENDSGDILNCEIHGKGEKQNCQNISIIVKKGIGMKLTRASDQKIDLEFLDSILN